MGQDDEGAQENRAHQRDDDPPVDLAALGLLGLGLSLGLTGPDGVVGALSRCANLLDEVTLLLAGGAGCTTEVDQTALGLGLLLLRLRVSESLCDGVGSALGGVAGSARGSTVAEARVEDLCVGGPDRCLVLLDSSRGDGQGGHNRGSEDGELHVEVGMCVLW